MMRRAVEDDFVALRDLEQAASMAAFAHIFPPQRYPFPADHVLARWRLVLDDPEVTVVVDEQDGRMQGLVAYDDEWLRHLAVHPDLWGQGIGARLTQIALQGIAAAGASTARLWVLKENHRARKLYERSGWVLGTESREGEYPPYPPIVSYTRDLSDIARYRPSAESLR